MGGTEDREYMNPLLFRAIFTSKAGGLVFIHTKYFMRDDVISMNGHLKMLSPPYHDRRNMYDYDTDE